MSRHLWLLPAITIALGAPTAARADSPTVTWSDPVTVASKASAVHPDIQSPLIASDDAGDLSALWLGGPNLTVQTSTRSATGTWSAPVELGSGDVSDLSLDVSPDGHAVAGWIQHHGDDIGDVLVSTRTSNGSWSVPTNLQPTVTTAGNESFTDDYAVRPADGGAILGLWVREYLDTVHQNSNGYEFMSDILGPDLPLAVPARAVGGLQLGVDAGGNATAVFLTEDADGHIDQVLTAFKSSKGVWGAATSLTGGSVGKKSFLGSPSLYVAPQGAVVVTWPQVDVSQTTTQSRIEIATQSGLTAPWAPTGDLVVLGPNSDLAPSAATINIDGTGVAVWRTDSGLQSGAFLVGKTGTKNGPPTVKSIQTVTSEAVDDIAPSLVADPGGINVVVWQGTHSGNRKISAAARDATGAWQAPIAVMDGTSDPLDYFSDTPSYSASVDASSNVNLLGTDGSTLLSATLSTAALDPPKPAPIVITQQPGGGSHTINTTKTPPPVVGGGIASHPHVMVKLYLVPTGKGKCPIRAVATVGTARTAIDVKKVRQSSGKIRCLASGAVPVPTTSKPGAKLSVLVSARGVAKRKLTFVVLV